MNILYLVFGHRISDHIQARFSICSFLKQTTGKDSIFVITTAPEYYQTLECVKTIAISDNVLREWEGEHRFFWRVKIKAIEYMATNYPDSHLMYIDSDTVLQGNLNGIRHELDSGNGLMHLDEGHPSRMKTKSLKMWNQVKGHTYGHITISERHNMWNAGVVAIPSKYLKDTVKLALELCDGMLGDNAERVVIEQWSLSIALFETTGLLAADKWVAHYWGNKDQWNDIATRFFIQSYMQGRTVDEEIEAFGDLKLDDMPLYIRKPNTQQRLVRLVKKLFPDKIKMG